MKYRILIFDERYKYHASNKQILATIFVISIKCNSTNPLHDRTCGIINDTYTDKYLLTNICVTWLQWVYSFWVTPYDGINLGQHWFRQGFVAWRHQVITWTNIDLPSMQSCGINLMAIPPAMFKISINKWRLIIKHLIPQVHFPEANELTERCFKHWLHNDDDLYRTVSWVPSRHIYAIMTSLLRQNDVILT